MAQSDNKKQFLVGSTGCAFKVLRISSLKFFRFSFDPAFSGMSEPTFYEAEGPSVKMALRVGGGTRSATFENQEEKRLGIHE